MLSTDTVLPWTGLEADPRGSLGTVRNAVALLHLLADGAPYQHLTDLAERSGLSVPTVHRLLRSLSLAGLVEQDTHSARYGLGSELIRFSTATSAGYRCSRHYRHTSRRYATPSAPPSMSRCTCAAASPTWIGSRADSGLYRQPHRIAPALSTAPGVCSPRGPTTPAGTRRSPAAPRPIGARPRSGGRPGAWPTT